MANTVWLVLILAGAAIGTVAGTGQETTRAAIEAAGSAVTLSLGLIGIMALWSGLMKIADRAGVVRWLSRLVAPAARLLFPSVPSDHRAIGAITMSLAANLLGMGNAATPLGIKAMEELASLAEAGDEASDAMCTFVAICTAGITLVPTSIIAIRAQHGSRNPAEVTAPIILVNVIATAVAIMADRLFRSVSKAARP